MTMQLTGSSAVFYGNANHHLTLAGAELYFYAADREPSQGQSRDQSQDQSRSSAKPQWFWKAESLSDLGQKPLAVATVAEDGSYNAVLKGYRGGALLIGIKTNGFDDMPRGDRFAEGFIGRAFPQDGDTQDDPVPENIDGRISAEAKLDAVVGKADFCSILEVLGLWLVAGRVSDCENDQVPVVGALVEVFDRDITQDDKLGEDHTDGSGSFQVYFDAAAFKQIPSLSPPFDVIVPHELIGGPDVFFTVSVGGLKLLDEPPSKGREAGRENQPRCSYHELCVKAPEITVDDFTLWTYIGDYQVPDTINLHDFDADGFVNNGKLAFFGGIDLIGQLAQTYLGEAVNFRFVFAEWPNMSTAPSYPADYQPLLPGNLVLNKAYGSIIVQTGPSPGDLSVTPVFPAPDPATGWIAVDQSPNFSRTTGRMVRLNTASLVPSIAGSSAMEGTAAAGDLVPLALRDRPRKFSFVLEVETASHSFHQTVPVTIHINNSLAYLHYDLASLQSNACSPISASGGQINLNALYSVAHPYLRQYSINVQRQGGTNLQAKSDSFTSHSSLWTDADGEHGSEAIVYTDIGKCSYRTWINASRRLTNGYGGAGNQNFLRTFCVD